MTTFTDRILRKIGLLPPLMVMNANAEKIAKAKRIEDLQKVPRYPPFMEGLPVYPPETLLETQHELIRGVREIIANRKLLEAHYYPAISRIACMYQLLPASQTHHHRGAGGLLRHSLEVGLYSLQAAEGKLIRGVVTPQQRHLIEPRWKLAIFLAGICHDLGKVVTDFTVTDRSNEVKWHPYKMGVYEWATENNLENYFIHWREGRGKAHSSIASTLLNEVVDKETLNWISDGSIDVMQWLTESLNNAPSAKNQIYDNVIKSDQFSVERDLKSMGVAMAGYEIGVPIERYLNDIMKNLVREGIWRINEPGARIWCMNKCTYIVWPKAGEEIAQRAREEDIPGLPKSIDGILDMMTERGMAFLQENKDDPFYSIAPDVLTEKIPDLKLRCVRLRDQALVSAMPIPDVAGKMVDAAESAADEGKGDSKPKETSYKSVDTSQLQIDLKAPPAPNAEVVTHQIAIPSVSDDAVCPPTVHQDEITEQPVKEKPGIVEPRESAAEPTSVVLTINKLTGATGELLKVLLADLENGKKDAAVLITRDIDNQVHCRWPDTFAGYGFTPKQILDGMTENGWMEAASDMAKVGEIDFADGTAKSIRLSPAVSALFTRGKKSPAIIHPKPEAMKTPEQPAVDEPSAITDKPATPTGKKRRKEGVKATSLDTSLPLSVLSAEITEVIKVECPETALFGGSPSVGLVSDGISFWN